MKKCDTALYISSGSFIVAIVTVGILISMIRAHESSQYDISKKAMLDALDEYYEGVAAVE